MSSTEQIWKGRLHMTLAMIFVATIGVFVKESGQSAMNIIFARCLIGSFVLGILYLFRRTPQINTGLTKKNLTFILLGGFLLVSNWIMLFQSYRYTSIGMSSVVYETSALFYLLMNVIFLKFKASKMSIVGVFVSLFGVFVLSNPLTFSDQGIQVFWGIGLALAAAICYGSSSFLVKMIEGVPQRLIILIQLMSALPLFACLVNWKALPGGALEWFYLLVMGVVHTAFVYILIYSAVKKLPASQMAALHYLYPAVAVLADYLIYGTPLTARTGVGFAMILSGILFTQMDIKFIHNTQSRVKSLSVGFRMCLRQSLKVFDHDKT